MSRPIALPALAAACAAILLTGCGGSPAKPAAAGNQGPAGTQAPTAAAVSPAAAPTDFCRYLTVDQVKQALQYQDTMQAGPDTTTGFNQCVYQAPDNGFVRVNLAIHRGRTDFDNTKSLYTSSDCTSAGIGEESYYCPKSNTGNVAFVRNGQSVNVSVSNVQNILKAQGADWNQAALALAKIVAAEL
jgi:hypothetical protein